MDSRHKQVITNNIKALVKKLDYEAVRNGFLNREIFPVKELIEIDSYASQEQRKYLLLFGLCKRGPLAYPTFLQILEETNQAEALSLLNSFENHTHYGPSLSHVNNNLSLPPESESGWIVNSSSRSNLKIKLSREPKVGPYYYDMSAKLRGYAIIINNVNFDINYINRKGSEQDAQNLDQIFRVFGFKTILRSDLSSKAIEDLFLKVAARPELQSHNALVIVILSHGIKNAVVGSDSTTLQVDRIFDIFDEINCPGLVNKPKLFFFQACRGSEKDYGLADGMPAPSEFRETAAAMNLQKKVLNAPRIHMLVSYASVLGYEAYKALNGPSWYGSCLVKNFSEFGCSLDVEQLLERVTKDVLEHCRDKPQMQVPQVESRLRKRLFFNPGLYKP